MNRNAAKTIKIASGFGIPFFRSDEMVGSRRSVITKAMMNGGRIPRTR
jgi:hypothetical protein